MTQQAANLAAPSRPRGMRLILLRVFSIYPGETGRALAAFAYLFLIVSSYLMIKTIRNAFFISEFGAMKLPYVMLGIAVLAGVFAAGYIRLAGRLPTPALTFWSLVFFAGNVLVFWWLARSGPRWLYPVIYVWAGVYGVIATTQVWTLANEIFTTRQAKRLFAFIGAGGVLGGAVGGGLSNRLAGLIGTTNLLLVVVVFLMLAAAVVRVLGRHRAVDTDRRERVDPPRNLAESLRAIAASKHLTLLAGLVFITALATTSIDFQFNIVAEREVGNSQDKLAAFFGAVYGSVALLSFVMQLLLTSRVMNYLGVGITILALPLLLVTGSITLLVTGSLAAGLALKGGDGMLKHSLDRSCRELLYLPVPARIKVNAKSTIDTVLDRMGDGAAGVIQIFITAGLGLGLQASIVANLFVIAAWLGVSRKLKGEYVNQLRESLRDPRRARPDVMVGGEADTREVLERTLREGNEEERLAALDWIAANSASIEEQVLLQLAHDESSPRVQRGALGILLAGDDVELPPSLLEDLDREGQAVLVSAIDLVIESREGCSPEKVESLLAQAGDTTRLSVVAFVVRRMGPDFEPFADSVFQALLDPATASRTRCAAVRALALLPATMKLPRRLAALIRDGDSAVREAAAETAARRRRVDLVPDLVEVLARPGSRRAVRRALQAFGQTTVEALAGVMQDTGAAAEARRQAPRVLGRLAGPRSVETLGAALADADPVVVDRSLRALRRLRVEGVRVATLLGTSAIEQGILQRLDQRRQLGGFVAALAAERADQAVDWLAAATEERTRKLLEQIFVLLAFLRPVEDIDRCRAALDVGTPIERANALEYLDNTLPRAIKKPLLPVLESTEPAPAGTPGGGESALRRLASWPDPWLAACALHAASRRSLAGLDEVLALARESGDPVLAGEAAAYHLPREGVS